MLAVRTSLVAFVLGVASLPGQIPAHASLLAATPQSQGFLVAQQDDAIHIVWNYVGSKYSGSRDGGRTWSILPQALPLGATDVACDGALVIVAGLAQASLGAPLDPSIMRSTDGGQSWSGPHSLLPSSPAHANYVSVHVDGLNVVCVWQEPYSFVRARRSTDGGVTWNPPTVLGPGGLRYSGAITKIAVGSSIQVFWPGFSFTTLQQVSADGGMTWLPGPRFRLVAQTAGNGSDLYSFDGGPLLGQSHDGGITWTSAAVPGVQACRSVACEGQVVVVGGTNSSPAGNVAVVNVSTDGGATWQLTPWSPGWSPVHLPRVHAVGGDLYLHLDSPNPTLQGGVMHSSDFGATWRVVQSGFDRFTFSPGPRRNIDILRVPLGPVYVDAVFVSTGYTTKGTGLPGTGSIVPELRLEGLPHLGGTPSVVVARAVGGTIGAVGFAVAPPPLVPGYIWPATIWLQGPLVLATVVTSGATGAAGAGSSALPFAIPANPSLVGSNLTAQALLVDAGAAAGFTVTNAIEVWMR